jgi:hypothetical protein
LRYERSIKIDIERFTISSNQHLTLVIPFMIKSESGGPILRIIEDILSIFYLRLHNLSLLLIGLIRYDILVHIELIFEMPFIDSR